MSGEGEPLRSGFLYFPRFWPAARGPWKPEPGRCRANVHAKGSSFHSHQCEKRAKVTREVLNGSTVEMVEYCGTHDPVRRKAADDARRTERDAKWDERQRLWDEQKRIQALEKAALAAIRQIAAGHNDPRTLALELLAEHGEGPTHG